ncbi:biotin/lipoate--protein ligase family protein [Ferrovibrio sp.]|uniref:biotin/lipoate--protein ligase family protein n=1 Tax=Ferrovibrio sp. TaxID=1917215 RepID=UPI001B533A83|nr:biotin/lipoate--protein ligase family protein [Ferrovibrio sp.]MBP7064384.1 hypothetical protein [Ferrovibrio sp.]
MKDWPIFPPGYEARLCLDDAFESAIAAAEAGAEDGLLLWQDRADRFNAAVLLRPLDPLDAALGLSQVGLLALLDALAGLAPAETPITLGWPDRLLVNDATAGGLRLAHGALVEKHGMLEVPDWLVLGFTLQLAPFGDADAPGLELEYTSLHEEGCGEVTAKLLVEAVAHHLLAWLNRWQETGFEPVRRAAEAFQALREAKLEPNGDLWLHDGTAKRLRVLRAALRQPSWVLPEAISA